MYYQLLDQALEQFMDAETISAFQKLLETGSVAVVAVVLGIAIIQLLRIGWRVVEQGRTAQNQNAESLQQNAKAIEILDRQQKSIDTLVDTAARIEGQASSAATYSFKSVESGEAVLRELDVIKQLIKVSTQDILNAQHDHEGKAMNRQTGTTSVLDNMKSEVLRINQALSETKQFFSGETEDLRGYMRQIKRYTMPADTSELAAPQKPSDAEDMPKAS